MTMKTYLPELGLAPLMSALETGHWSAIDEQLAQQDYERLGLERILAVAADLYARHGRLEGLRVLDVGCNNGLFGKTLAALGCRVLGIDNGDVDGQGLYEALPLGERAARLELRRIDLLDFLDSDTRPWDCVLLFSVAHHWETGYAMSGARRYTDADLQRIFATLMRRTRRSIYYECPVDEPGFEPGYGVHFLLRHLPTLPTLRLLGPTIGPNGYLRELWSLDLE